jgi:uncharacterized protein YgbK (DUF1537 family)
MAECVVIADDLTGGNATGVLLTKMNYRAYTVLNKDGISPEIMEGCDCVIYPTDSRGVSPDEAYRRVKEAVALFASDKVKVYSHRIDSTLRGNLGAETDAMLDYLGSDSIALVAPAFPSSGRTVAGGYLLVNGMPVNKTNIAIDPKTPVKTALVEKLFREQSRYPVSSIHFSEMEDGKHKLAERINERVERGARIITFDCVTQEDLDLIADAAITSKKKVVAVDPGVFTATLTRKTVMPHSKEQKRRILAVVGSVNPNTKDQMEELWLTQHPIYNCFVKTKQFLESEEDRREEISRVCDDIIAKADFNTVLTVTGDGLYPENRIDFAPYMEKWNCSLDEITGRINESFAEIAERILQQVPSIQGIYLSGGDITQAVCQKVNAAGFDLKDEVLPLAAYGQFLEGEFDGLMVVTKGGSQGNKDAINICVNYLKEKLFI